MLKVFKWSWSFYWVIKWYEWYLKKNLEGYNPNKKRKILIVFDDMIADMPSNKQKRDPIATELFVKYLISLFSTILD